MVKHILTTVLTALAMLWSAASHAADTLADMDIAVDQALIAYGIDPGEKHPVAGEFKPFHATPQPQLTLGQVPRVYLLGDSIIAGIPRIDGIYNLAVPGRQTGELAGEMAHIPAGFARTIYIEGGINDYVHGSPINIVSNYQALLASAPTGAQIRVIGILPVNESQLAPASAARVTNAQIMATDARITGLCTGRCSVVTPPFGKNLPANLTDGAGVHLNNSGKAVLSAIIKH